MLAALALAGRGLGRVSPNPAVGCVITDCDGFVAGRGWTQPGGRPHAETEALRRAGGKAKGGTAYVSLEPCAHHGQTPPCAEALIAAGIARVVVATRDPDPRVSGKGIAMLSKAGIAVAEGLCEDQARALNAGFFLRITEGRPLVTAKAASSLDGRSAMASGESRWITGEAARAHGHLLRASHDAILVGMGTVHMDDPMLDCRLPGLEGQSPVRVVLEGERRLPIDCRLVRTAREIPTWLVTHREGEEYRERGVEVVTTKGDLKAIVRLLGTMGITRLLVEGGAAVLASFFSAGLVDQGVWFRSSSLIGGDGRPAVGGLGMEHLKDIPRFSLVECRRVGEDVMERYVRH